MTTMNETFETIVDDICEEDSRYKADAYVFLMEALGYTQRKFKAEKHISGEQLLVGIRELMLKRFGPMTLTVLEHWGIESTEDFGNMVFHLVERRALSKTDEDRFEQFVDAYDFQEVFTEDYRKRLARRISRM